MLANQSPAVLDVSFPTTANCGMPTDLPCLRRFYSSRSAIIHPFVHYPPPGWPRPPPPSSPRAALASSRFSTRSVSWPATQLVRRWGARVTEYTGLHLFRGRGRSGTTLIGWWRFLQSAYLDFLSGGSYPSSPIQESSSYSRFGRRSAKVPRLLQQCARIVPDAKIPVKLHEEFCSSGEEFQSALKAEEKAAAGMIRRLERVYRFEADDLNWRDKRRYNLDRFNSGSELRRIRQENDELKAQLESVREGWRTTLGRAEFALDSASQARSSVFDSYNQGVAHYT